MKLVFPELLELKGAETRDGIGHKDNLTHTYKVVDNMAKALATAPPWAREEPLAPLGSAPPRHREAPHQAALTSASAGRSTTTTSSV